MMRLRRSGLCRGALCVVLFGRREASSTFGLCAPPDAAHPVGCRDVATGQG